LLTVDEIYGLLSGLKDEDIKYAVHFLARLKIRGQIGNVKLEDIEEIRKILLNRCPVCIEYQGNDEYKVYYDITGTHDLVIIMWLRVSTKTNVKLITLYPQKINRRLNKNGRQL